MEIPFVGGAYEQRSLSINAQRSINCFPVVDKQDAKNVVAMYGTPGLKFFAMATLYGSGADGVVTISADTTLVRDMQYSTLTVNAGITLNTAGFTVMCDTLLTNNGIITDSSSGGAGGTGGTGYGNSGTYGQEATKPGAGAGGNGGAGGGTVGVGGTGGKGGGVVRIFAKTLTNNGTIHANGTAATDASGAGGYGADGGDGGTVILYYDARTVGTVTATAGAASNGVAYEPVDSNDLLYLTFDGYDGSTTFTDATGRHTFTAEGGAKLSTSIKKLGTASLNLNGTTDFITATDHADWDLPDTFTISTFIYFKSLNDDAIILSHYEDTSNWWKLYINEYRQIIIFGQHGTEFIYSQTSYYFNLNSFYHIEVAKDGDGVWYVFVEGDKKTSYNRTVCSTAFPDITGSMNIGYANYGGGGGFNWYFDGYINDLRIRKVVKHTESFTPPVEHGRAAVNGSAGSAGTASWVSLPYTAFSSAVFRGALVNGSTLYAVVGANILSIATTGVATVLGTITTTTGNVFLASNGAQVLIVDGTTAGHFITTATGVVTDVTLPCEASSCAFCDGYFIITHLSTQEIFISGLYDATAWDAGDHEYVEGSPDNLLRVMHCNHMLWMFGVSTIEVFYNSGAADFPFARISGALIDKGLGATASVVLVDNQFYFLSDKFEVLRTVGYQFEKISTIHIETEIQGYATKNDAIGYEYRIDGHIFYVITFPTADTTWVFDTTTGYWHEWQSYKTQGTATFGRHRGAIGFFFNDKYMVGDHTNGKIYELDMATYTDDGEYIKRTRRAPYINKDRKRVAHFEIDLEFESGVGLGGTSDPQVGLTWSDDGGNNWATVQYRDLGELAAYKARQRWLRLGMARNRIYELTMYEPVKFVLIGSSANIEGESS
jgi:hypothetical protein